jgi:hypothetical protein
MIAFYLKNGQDIADLNARLTLMVKGEEFGVHVQVELGMRTPKQNSALHVYCKLLADALNEAGYLLVVPGFKEGFEVPWTGDMVKENIWRPIQEAMFEIKSTTQLNRRQVSEVYEVIARNMSVNRQISVPFPQNQFPD